MGYAKSAKLFLGLVIAALLTASTVYLAESPRQKIPRLSARDIRINQAEVTIDGFRFANTESDKLSWQVTASKAEVKKDTGSAKLHDLEAVFNGKEGLVLTLKSDEGVFDAGTKAMSLQKCENDITVTSNNGCRMLAEDLKWDNTGKVLSTDKNVRIDFKNVTIEGKGMVAKADLQQVRINNGVKTVFNQSE